MPQSAQSDDVIDARQRHQQLHPRLLAGDCDQLRSGFANFQLDRCQLTQLAVQHQAIGLASPQISATPVRPWSTAAGKAVQQQPSQQALDVVLEPRTLPHQGRAVRDQACASAASCSSGCQTSGR